ncbi:hypothetical protein [Bacillus pseudomycoides]|uniref:hypothetical protein n=1 Tax=Bacillus pseudomycoides TaxID=64104 RepID=UPI003CF2D8B1
MITSDMLQVEVKEEKKFNSYHITRYKKETDQIDKLYHIYFLKQLEIHEISNNKNGCKMTTNIFPYAGIDYATFKLTSDEEYQSIYRKNVVLKLYNKGQEIYTLQISIEDKKLADEEYSNALDKKLYNMFYSFNDDLEKGIHFLGKANL